MIDLKNNVKSGFYHPILYFSLLCLMLCGLYSTLFAQNSQPTATQTDLAQIDLGRKLFFDKRLSRDETLSCATCHNPEQGFTQTDRPVPIGISGQKGRRNTPTLLDVAQNHYLHRDGRETSLETQYILPLTAPDEMGNPSVGLVLDRLKLLDDYVSLFEKTFQKPPNADTLGFALAAYQKSLVSGPSRFEKWYFAKDETALNAKEKTGFALFTGRGKCSSCHQIGEREALFTDHAFHDIGHSWELAQKRTKDQPDLGRYEVTKNPLDKWRFKTPSLRNITLTPPYMHDGAFSSLEDVIRFYSKGGAPHKGQDERIQKLDLSEGEITALVAFLGTLKGEK